jgi:protease-4
MKEFFKYVMATICGILILGIVMSIMFIVSLAGMALSGNSTVKVKKNSVFTLKLNGTVQERGQEDSPLNFLLGQADMSVMGLDDLVSSIRKAKEQDEIKGIYLETNAVTFDSPAIAQELRDALKDFKKSGKWIIAYGDNFTQTAYYVASVADSVFMNKTGMLELKGLGGKGEYYLGLYEKLGVKYQAVKVGKYKSAVERHIRKDMSEEDREQRMAFLQGVWQYWLKDIAESRNLKPEQIDQMVSDSIMAFAAPQYYVKSKLIDRLMYPESIKKVIKAKLGVEEDKDIRQMMFSDMMNVEKKEKDKGEKVAVYYAFGEIIDATSSMFSTEHSIIGSTTVNDLKKLADDKDVKAVVLRVNSPGGSAVASEQIWHAIKLLKEKKPVVVSMGGYAASGGYMISAGADYIIAEPTTITGSIGIFGLVPNLSGLVTDKLGVTFDGAKTNKYTDFEENLVMSKDNSEEIKFMQSYVDRGYETFLNIVADGRKMTRDQVHEIAQGRVWLATDALPIKLVDKIGSLDDAVKKAAELAKLDEYHTAAYPAEPGFLESLMAEESESSYLNNELREVLGDLYEPILNMRKDQQRNRLQARLPYLLSIE